MIQSFDVTERKMLSVPSIVKIFLTADGTSSNYTVQ